MAIREITVSGVDALNLATALLQRARQAHPTLGLWEAADLQWSWRKQRLSDDIEKLFWLDDVGPVAALLLTSEGENLWQFDPVLVSDTSEITPEHLWGCALSHMARVTTGTVEVPIRDDDQILQSLALAAGFRANGGDRTGWMESSRIPAVSKFPNGLHFVDRLQNSDSPHPMGHRNGSEVASRLQQCSLYDRELDLAVESTDGRVAGYSLYWFDPVTRVGLVEPVRVEDEFQRRGVARAMLTEGINRLVAKGASRIKVSWETQEAGRLYEGIGFQPNSSTTWYRLPRT